MNRCIFVGRLTRDPDIKQSQGGITIARFSIAVDRMKTKDNQNPGADFLNCVAFGSRGEFIEKYFHKGSKIILETHVQTGSYDGQNGKVYTTDFIVDNAEFGESKNAQGNAQANSEQPANNAPQADNNGFMNIPDNMAEELPFN